MPCSLPHIASTGSHVHRLPNGFSPWEVLAEDRREEVGKAQDRSALCPSDKWGSPQGSPLHWTSFPVRFGNHSVLTSSDLQRLERAAARGSGIILLLWLPCTFVKSPFPQHSKTCPNTSVPLRILSIIKNKSKKIFNMISRQWEMHKGTNFKLHGKFFQTAKEILFNRLYLAYLSDDKQNEQRNSISKCCKRSTPNYTARTEILRLREPTTFLLF